MEGHYESYEKDTEVICHWLIGKEDRVNPRSFSVLMTHYVFEHNYSYSIIFIRNGYLDETREGDAYAGQKR